MFEISTLKMEVLQIPAHFWKLYVANWLHTFVMTVAYIF